MPKLSDLINLHTVALTSEPADLTADDALNLDRVKTRRFHVNLIGSVRSFDFYFYGRYDNVVIPSDHRYHPRYLASVPAGQTISVGDVMSEDWWLAYGYLVAPPLSEIGGYLADLSFTFTSINSFEDFCSLKGLNVDSRRAYAYYQELLDIVTRLRTFLGEFYDAFLNADIDL